MNVGDNSLLQGTTPPTADEVGGPSGEPAAHLKETLSHGQAHYQVEVAPYNSAWFNKFGKHLVAKMCWMNAHGHRVILISLLPLYPVPCCWSPNYFPPNFNYKLFIREIFKLGVFMSRMKCMESSIVLTPKDICSREEWIVPGAIISKDWVQVSREVHETSCCLDLTEWEYSWGSAIPSEILFSTWVKVFWTSCGYEFPVLMGGRSAHVLRTPARDQQNNVIELSQCTVYRHLLCLMPTKLDPPKACCTG